MEKEILKVINSEHHEPSKILGMHEDIKDGKKISIVRYFNPHLQEVYVLDKDDQNVSDDVREYKMEKISDKGLFEVEIQRPNFNYMLKVIDENGNEKVFHDAYSFSPVLTQFDLHLFNEGNNFQIYEKMGAHPMRHQGVDGVLFAVWAPNALRVSVVGDFNSWDGRIHQMRLRESSGIWELFIPQIDEGEIYKYEIKTQEKNLLLKSDPYGFYQELRPKTGSIVYSLEGFNWEDEEWMQKREEKDLYTKPMSIYEVHLGSWMRVEEENNRFLTYKELAHKLVDYVKELEFTHIELLPISEHPFDASWGYQTTGYFAATSRFGEPKDFMYFVNHCHKHGIGVIIDWVPAHFPKDDHALRVFDGTCLYEHRDWRQAEHPDWGTLIFNYGRNEVRNFLLANAFFWLDKYHIDGLRVDAVASMLYLDYSREEGEWIPNIYGGNENLEAIDFIKKFNEIVYSNFSGVITIAEESTSWPGVSSPIHLGGLGFGMKWNMGWMNDFLEYFTKEPIYRKYHHGELTFALLYAFHENFILVLSHDEVVYGKRSLLNKMPGNDWQKFANLRLLFGIQYGYPGKKLLFMGGEFGQWDEWYYDKGLDWNLLQYEPHQRLQNFVKELNKMYRNEPALYESDFHYSGFEWIDFSDADKSIISFIRKAKNESDYLVFVCNFTPITRTDYRVGVPENVKYREILNSNDEIYGGNNEGKHNSLFPHPVPWNDKPYSLNLTLPPLSVLIFKPER